MKKVLYIAIALLGPIFNTAAENLSSLVCNLVNAKRSAKFSKKTEDKQLAQSTTEELYEKIKTTFSPIEEKVKETLESFLPTKQDYTENTAKNDAIVLALYIKKFMTSKKIWSSNPLELFTTTVTKLTDLEKNILELQINKIKDTETLGLINLANKYLENIKKLSEKSQNAYINALMTYLLFKNQPEAMKEAFKELIKKTDPKDSNAIVLAKETKNNLYKSISTFTVSKPKITPEDYINLVKELKIPENPSLQIAILESYKKHTNEHKEALQKLFYIAPLENLTKDLQALALKKKN